MDQLSLPARQGLYDPINEHDSCGVGFVCHIKGKRSHSIVELGLLILKNLTHRGAVGADPKASDGAGILVQMVCVAIALSGHGVMEFWAANVLLGLGWCLSFTAATNCLSVNGLGRNENCSPAGRLFSKASSA